MIGCVCAAGADGCGAHGACVNGLCKCDEGYGGAMCETIVDACKIPVKVDCGAHGSCVDGSCVCESGAYSGDRCQNVDQCFGVECGSHGDCVNGSCECKDRYSGSRCTQAPLPCCCGRVGSLADGCCFSVCGCRVSQRWDQTWSTSGACGYQASCHSGECDRSCLCLAK
jgi:hypothetical protein